MGDLHDACADAQTLAAVSRVDSRLLSILAQAHDGIVALESSAFGGQPADAILTTLSNVSDFDIAASQLAGLDIILYIDHNGQTQISTITAAARSILDDVTVGNILTTIGGQPAGSYQTLSTNLTSLAGLSFAATAFVKMTSAGTFGLDTSTYLTAVTAHNALSATHGDTLVDSVARGDVMYGNATPKWARLAFPTSPTGKVLQATATDVAWSTNPLTIGASASVSGSNTGDQTLGGLGGQPLAAGLTDIAGLAVTDSNVIVGNGTHWVAETGATLRTSLGLGTGDSPQFTKVGLGAAADAAKLLNIVIDQTTSNAGVYAFETSGAGSVAKNVIAAYANNTAGSNTYYGWNHAIGQTFGVSAAGAISASSTFTLRNGRLDGGSPGAITATITASSGAASFIGDLTLGANAGTSRYLYLNSAAAYVRYLSFQTAGVARWLLGTNATAESGANAGSDWALIRYSDAGASLGTPISIARATGAVTLEGNLTVNGGAIDTTAASLVLGSGGVGYCVIATGYTVVAGVKVGALGNPGSANAYIDGNCSALSFTDRTKWYDDDGVVAVKNIAKHSGSNSHLDHSTLPSFARKTVSLTMPDGSTVTEDGRDLGAMVTILTIALQQVIKRLEDVEKKDK